jgi:hypothetical protein
MKFGIASLVAAAALSLSPDTASAQVFYGRPVVSPYGGFYNNPYYGGGFYGYPRYGYSGFGYGGYGSGFSLSIGRGFGGGFYPGYSSFYRPYYGGGFYNRGFYGPYRYRY